MDNPEDQYDQLQSFTCERCGFTYRKTTDFHPYLCYRCMRYIAKRVFVTMNTITPLSRPERTPD
jgi:protein-arginine kinase activator protein McsA